MDKKQFFESLVSLLPDKSGQRIDAFGKIQNLFDSLKSHLSNTGLQHEFEQIEREILFHVWMFERICNGEVPLWKNEDVVPWPLIIISVSWEILFANKEYCRLSGLSPAEIRSHESAGTLYDEVYGWSEAYQAEEAVSRLQAGKGYKHLELSMKHSGKKISWNSYGWVGESMEIRSGREVSKENDQERERDRFYRGGIMNSTRLIENLYQVSVHGALSEEDEQKLAWVQEFLCMFDFLWNHSGLFMEIIDMPTIQEGKIYGFYNTVYAQFLKHSFDEQKKFKDILSIVHGSTFLKFMEARKFQNTLSAGEYTFHEFNRCPIARVYWRYSTYPYEVLPGYERMFSLGMLVRKLPRKNMIALFFQRLFKKTTHQ